MKPIEQLQEILCTVPSVEKDVKELRFGCKVTLQSDIENDKPSIVINQNWSNTRCWENAFNILNTIWVYSTASITDYEKFSSNHRIKAIIWNPLTLKHLMMYCNEKWIFLQIDSLWSIYDISTWFAKYIWVYDIKKELHEQEDKVLLDIINFLKG